MSPPRHRNHNNHIRAPPQCTPSRITIDHIIQTSYYRRVRTTTSKQVEHIIQGLSIVLEDQGRLNKSQFIEALAGPENKLGISGGTLESVTQEVQAYKVVNARYDWRHGPPRPVFLVDTPGFLDVNLSGMEILYKGNKWETENGFDRRSGRQNNIKEGTRLVKFQNTNASALKILTETSDDGYVYEPLFSFYETWSDETYCTDLLTPALEEFCRGANVDPKTARAHANKQTQAAQHNIEAQGAPQGFASHTHPFSQWYLQHTGHASSVQHVGSAQNNHDQNTAVDDDSDDSMQTYQSSSEKNADSEDTTKKQVDQDESNNDHVQIDATGADESDSDTSLEYVDDPLLAQNAGAAPRANNNMHINNPSNTSHSSSSDPSSSPSSSLYSSHGSDSESVESSLDPAHLADSEDELDEEARNIMEAEQRYSNINHIRMVQQYIERIESATLDNGKLPDFVIEALRNPQNHVVNMEDEDAQLSINLYLACFNSSEATYALVSDAIQARFPECSILSYKAVKQRIASMTGVISVQDDMCIKGCLAFTGPFEDLEHCSSCGEARYFEAAPGQKRVARKTMSTVPLGPQLQAIRQSPLGSEAMQYREQKVQEVYDHLDRITAAGTAKSDVVYDDIFTGSQFLELHEKLEMTEDDTTVMFSLDGAQLYRDKESDTWIAIWIATDYNPVTRYRSKRVLPALVIPGPHKPQNLESFLFRSFHHLSALQRENNGKGMKMFDATSQRIIESRIILLFATADAIGLPELDGRVGHHGAQGCRLGCPMKGRHKPGSGHYFAAHLQPNNYTVHDCNHPDFNFRQVSQLRINPDVYKENIGKITSAQTQGEYEDARKLTGLSKPTLLSGLRAVY
ncbi:hypothetical protein CVT24_003783 [Panaeolus cyanescens]|uniref:G domain-containing protein n=1 Tax=Panaeolus cyanescens TaxID=181874 RepID=A0A409W841_9AGAR|nr:hypothetical protein CVT24_003783 [Panaeolus cyanescens]